MVNDLWYKNAIIYCLSVGTFMDANADGVGDFQGLLRRLDYLQTHLSAHEYLVERFTVADAYLTTVLNWAKHCDVDLAQWPAVDAYYHRIVQRPHVAKALAEEIALYREEQALQ